MPSLNRHQQTCVGKNRSKQTKLQCSADLLLQLLTLVLFAFVFVFTSSRLKQPPCALAYQNYLINAINLRSVSSFVCFLSELVISLVNTQLACPGCLSVSRSCTHSQIFITSLFFLSFVIICFRFFFVSTKRNVSQCVCVTN